MVKFKSLIAGAFGLAAGLLLLTGCSKPNNENHPASSEASDLEHMDISVAIWGIQEAFEHPNAANDTIFNALEEKFNVTFVPMGVTWDDYQEKNRKWAATGSLPDIFADNLTVDNPSLYQTWAEQGLIKEIPEDLSAFPNLEMLMNSEPVKAVSVDGRQYMIPRGTDPSAVVSTGDGMGRAIMYRKDWALEAGFDEAPESYDEMVEMIRAMMAIHPEAAGIVTNNSDYLGTLSLDIMPEYSSISSWVYEEGQWMPCYASERVIPYLERVQKLYAEGILDPDFVLQKDGDAIAKFTNGYACVSLGGQMYAADFMAANPEVENFEDAVGFILPFEADDGNAYFFTGTSYWWSETYISSKVSDAKLERILMILDYMYSEEYMSLVENGIEGVDWAYRDGEMVSLLSPDESLSYKYPVTMSIGWLASWGYGDTVISSDPAEAAYTRLVREADAYERENMQAVPINFSILMMDNQEKEAISGLAAEFQDRANDIIVSNADVRAAWEAVMDFFNERGLGEAIASVTAQALDEGIQP